VKVFEAGETKDAFGINQNTLNRAVAIAMCDGPEAGLAHIDAVLEQANWQIITWRIPPFRICTAGSAGPLRLGPLMRKLWP
jgi:hypothetical protein